MATQSGLIKLNGSIGDLVFYTLNGKTVVRRKPTVSKNKRKNDPSYERVRESNREFGGASKLSAFIRKIVRPYSCLDPNNKLNNQLTSGFLKMIQQGPGSRGQRTISWTDDYSDLKSISLTSAQQIQNYLSGKAKVNVDNSQITCSLENSSLSNFPQGADSFKCSFLVLPLPDLSFNNNKYFLSNDSNPIICLSGELQAIGSDYSQDFNFSVPASITNNNFMIFQLLQFYQTVNNHHYPLQSTPFQIMEIITLNS